MFLTILGLGLWAALKLYSQQYRKRYLYLETTSYVLVLVGALLYLLFPGVI